MPSRLPVVGADTGVWGTVLNDWLSKTTAGVKNVQVYGATGDGTTDDTAAFASTRDAAGAGGGIYVPAGTYVLTGLALNVAGQTWKLERGATLLTKASTGTTAQIAVSAAGVTIAGPGILDGNRANNTPSVNQDIIKVNADQFTLAGAVLQNVTRAGVYVGGSASFNEMVITGCRFSNCGTQAVGVLGSIAAATDGVQIIGNTIDQYAATAFDASNGPNGIQFYNWPLVNSLTNVVIANNYIRCYPYLAAELANQDSGIVMAGVTGYVISGNTIETAAYGLSLPSNTYGTISGNLITGWCQYGIEVPSYSTVTGNIFNSTDPRSASGTHAGTAVLISTGNVTYANITGNHFSQVASAAGAASIQIWPAGVGNMSHITVEGNQMLHLGGGSAILVNHAVSFLTVQGNMIDGNGQQLTGLTLYSDNLASPVTQYAVSVIGNTFANYGSGTGILWGNTGVLNATALDYAIFANNIFRSGTTGIGVTGSPGSGAHCNIAAGSNIGP